VQHLRFREFEAYSAALGDVDIRLTLLRRQQPLWELESLWAGKLHIQHGHTASPLLAEAAADAGGRLFFMPVEGRCAVNGQPGDDQMVLVVDGGADFTVAVEAEHEWLAVFLPSKLLDVSDERAAGPRVQTSSRIVRPATEHAARVRCLLARAVEAARFEPAVLTAPAARTKMQADILAACRPIAGPLSALVAATGWPRISRTDIVRAAKDLIDNCEDQVPTIDDLARAADVSVRTLQTAFLDYYGIPPLQYLTLRRLHRVRARLQKADADQTTVTRIAAQFGFWQFGRFAGQYRRLFGERPSETLRGGASKMKRPHPAMGI
jgi:AraC family ethanolamine operon transcriptional activator